MDQQVDGIIRVIPIQIGAWGRQCAIMVMYLWDLELILGMDFLMGAEVSILLYLGALAFLEQGTPCTVNTLREGDMVGSYSNWIRMVSIIEILGSWPEGSGHLDFS